MNAICKQQTDKSYREVVQSPGSNIGIWNFLIGKIIFKCRRRNSIYSIRLNKSFFFALRNQLVHFSYRKWSTNCVNNGKILVAMEATWSLSITEYQKPNTLEHTINFHNLSTCIWCGLATVQCMAIFSYFTSFEENMCSWVEIYA